MTSGTASVPASAVHEVDVEVVDSRRELRPHVHPLLGGPEVVLVAPVPSQVLHERERDPLRPVVDGLALRPAGVPQPRAEVVDRGGIERHAERNDVGIGHQLLLRSSSEASDHAEAAEGGMVGEGGREAWDVDQHDRSAS